MNVIKRDNTIQGVDFNKITERISKVINEQTLEIDPISIAQKVCSSLSDNIKTTELDKLTAEIAVSMSTTHPDYSTLAAAITISDMHKNTKGLVFSDVINLLPNIDQSLKNFIQENKDTINSEIDYNKDYLFDYFAIKTLEKAYLHKNLERPQDLFMRVALAIHYPSLQDAFETYHYMSDKKFIHATPTLYNGGTNQQQLASCFLQDIGDDSISSIYKTLADSAQISKYAGGIGLHIHNIRSSGSEINKIPNMSRGILPMLKVFNETAKYVCQSGKRNGSIAIYLQVDHPDIFQFLDMKKNTGDEDDRARDLFYAAWIPDLFMERVKNNQMWSLFCPHTAPGLADVHSEEYNALYKQYEEEHRYTRQVKAQELWFAICTSQIETGTPYMLYKDSINRKSNQMNLGTIKSSNLCTEIVQYTSKEETAVCNLASICLPQFIRGVAPPHGAMPLALGEFDFKELRKVAGILTKNLNNVIDRNFYPIPEAETSNMRHRPIGIGVQGLADTYILLNMPFESQEAKELNKKIFETIYLGAMESSLALAKQYGPYESFHGSPLSEGMFQFNLSENKNIDLYYKEEFTKLRNEIKIHGVRNSLLVAPMPTASTSQIMGNNECIEPYTSNLYLRRTMAGEFVVINKHLVKDLLSLNLWSKQLKDSIIQHNGSIQNIPQIPDNLKSLYKTAWEISQKVLIDQASDRQNFICQSQSMNLFIGKPDMSKLSSMHFYAWTKGLKTGMYYLRTQPAANPIQFTIDPVCESCSG